jgi:hypothetical protein
MQHERLIQQFGDACAGFRDIVHNIGADEWSAPALGDWDVRALCGHTLRAILLAGDSAARPAATATLTDAGHYFRNAFALDAAGRADLDRGIAERGIVAGANLGADPATAVDAAIEQAWAVVATANPSQPVEVAGGTLAYHEYLRTRLFELVIHTDDLCRATDQAPPFDDDIWRTVAEVAMGAGDSASLPDLLRAALGRGELVTPFSLFC